MTSSSRPGVHAALDLGPLAAPAWSLEELADERPAARTAAAEHGAAPTGPEAAPAEPAQPDEWIVDAAGLERMRDEVAAELAEQMEAEVERRLAAAYEEGYEQGRQQGEEAEGTRLRNAVQLAESALDEVREGEMRWTGAIEENVCALAVAVARQLLGRELSTDQAAVVELVRAALAEFPIDQPVRVRVHPQDLTTLQSATGAGGMLKLPPEREARWVADARIAPGGCVVEGRERIVDGRIDTALERIYRRLTYAHA